MSMEIHIEGPNAEQLAAQTGAFFAETFGSSPLRQPAPLDTVPTRISGLEVAALLFVVPRTINESLDLAARLKLVEKVDLLLQSLKKTAAKADRVLLHLKSGEALDLLTATRDKVMDFFARSNDDDTP